jgi:DHA2 family multidrug resistance protein
MTAVAAPATAPWAPRHNPWLIAVVVTMATFMEVLDTTITNVALPHIAGSLAAGYDEATWVLTSYMVANAIILPTSAWLSALLGRKRFYMGCVFLFTLSSLACGLAPSLPTLVFFRVLQGLAGGGMQPAGQAFLVDTFPKEKRGMAFAVAGIAMVSAPVIGPTLGGFITDNLSWRWAFFINVPVGILSLVLTAWLVEDSPFARRIKLGNGIGMDYIGLGLIALGLGSLQVVLDKGERADWFSSAYICAFAVVAVVALIVAVIWEWHQEHPVTDVRMFKDLNFALANIYMYAVGFFLFGSTVLIPLLVQTRMGYTATWAGLVVSPGALMVILLLPLVGRLVTRYQPRTLIMVGVFAAGIALLRHGTLSLQADYWTIAFDRMLMGIGIAFLFVPINTAAYGFIPPSKNNDASAILSLSRNLGSSTGIAVVMTLLSRHSQIHQNTLVAHLTPYNPVYNETINQLAQRFAEGAVVNADALLQAQALLYHHILNSQAAMLAYVDDFRFLGFTLLLLLPGVFLFKRIPKDHAAVMME